MSPDDSLFGYNTYNSLLGFPWSDIFAFIGSFLSLLSQRPCCLTTGREGAMGEREKGRDRDNASNERTGETKWKKKRKGKKEDHVRRACTFKLKPRMQTVAVWNQYKDLMRSWMKGGKGEKISNEGRNAVLWTCYPKSNLIHFFVLRLQNVYFNNFHCQQWGTINSKHTILFSLVNWNR